MSLYYDYDSIVLYFDGASRHNPHGPAGCGFVICEMNYDGSDGNEIARGSTYLGYYVSNNQAEYEGLLQGLQYIIDNNISVGDTIHVCGDSEVVIRQMEGYYQVRSPNIIDYYRSAVNLLSYVECYVRFEHIPRWQNEEADALANEAIYSETSYIHASY